jgi:hypothetical protein
MNLDEYYDYRERAANRHAPDLCFHCHGDINLDNCINIIKTIQKPSLAAPNVITRYNRTLFFCHDCFYNIAGDKYFIKEE